MDRRAHRADATDAMTTMLRHQQRSGRFGREVRGDDAQTDDAHERNERVGYVIDPDAVAAAIVKRLVAGRTFPTLLPKP
jgi:hypothetical protein